MMKRIGSLFLAVLLLCTAMIVPLTAEASYSLPDTVKTHSKAAVVVFLGTSAENDAVMYEQNADQRLAPAGLVRIAVGLYALKTLEEQSIDPAVATGTFTQGLSDTVSDLGMVTVNMQVGDVWRVEDLLSISMLQTAADALTTLVATLSGTQDAFVTGMNELVKEIGCTDTQFVNVYGLDDEQQYTSARDMYRILRYASLNYPELTSILSLSEYTVHPVKGEVDSWPSTNEMLRNSSAYYYSPLVYGRSGYTESIGQSCASVARDEGYEFMTVVLGCESEPIKTPEPTDTTDPSQEGEQPEQTEQTDDSPAFTDTMTLFRWVYNHFSYTSIVSKGQPVSRVPVSLAWSTDSVALVAAEDLSCMLRNGADVNSLRYEISLINDELTAPVEKGQICGTAAVYDGDEKIGQFDLASSEAISRSQIMALLDAIRRVVTSPIMLTVLGLLLLLLIGYVIVGTVHNNRRRSKRQKRVKRYK